MGSGGAIALRVLVFFGLQLLALSYLKAVGVVRLLWIGVNLLPEKVSDSYTKVEAKVEGSTHTKLGQPPR